MVTKPDIGQESWGQALNNALDELQGENDSHQAAADPHGAKAYADANFRSAAVYNVEDWLADGPVLVAHRGGGMEMPEHTLAAYDAAVAASVKAIEVSVHLTADGVPVCIHDSTLDRTTNATGPVNALTWAELRETVRVTEQDLFGSGMGDHPIPSLREVLDRFLGRVIIFLDAKSNEAIITVQNVLETFYPEAHRSVVWKNYYASNSFPWAKNRGFYTWGYFFVGDNVSNADLNSHDENVDIWGPEHKETDARLSEIIARGKPVIAHVAHRKYQVDRLNTLGCAGVMCSVPTYITNAPEIAADHFSGQVGGVGILPFAEYDGDYGLKFDGAGGAYTERLSGEAICMARHKAPAGSGYTISYSLKWDTLPVTTSQHADLVLGKHSDDRFKYFSADNESAGYTIFHRATGEIAIYTHMPGSSSSTQLGTLSTEAPVAGTYMTFTLQVTETQVILTRTDTATPYELAVTDDQFRGRYWHLGNGSVSDQVATWADITVS